MISWINCTAKNISSKLSNILNFVIFSRKWTFLLTEISMSGIKCVLSLLFNKTGSLGFFFKWWYFNDSLFWKSCLKCHLTHYFLQKLKTKLFKRSVFYLFHSKETLYAETVTMYFAIAIETDFYYLTNV